MTDTELRRREAICKVAGVKDIGELSDGFHTFNALYEQRMILFAALVRAYKDKAWKSYRHDDGEYCFGGGWFIVGIDTPEGSYTYHYENKYWDMFDCIDLPRAKHWDGHTEADAETRLMSLPERKTDGDVISRQAAIDAIMDMCEECDSSYCGECRVNFPGLKDCKKVLEGLPPAQPESTRTFVELVVRYTDPELCIYKEYKGKPYYSIKYIENGETYIGYSTYNLEVLSQYLKEYFILSAQPEPCEKDIIGMIKKYTNCPVGECKKAFDIGIDYLRSKSRVKG